MRLGRGARARLRSVFQLETVEEIGERPAHHHKKEKCHSTCVAGADSLRMTCAFNHWVCKPLMISMLPTTPLMPILTVRVHLVPALCAGGVAASGCGSGTALKRGCSSATLGEMTRVAIRHATCKLMMTYLSSLTPKQPQFRRAAAAATRRHITAQCCRVSSFARLIASSYLQQTHKQNHAESRHADLPSGWEGVWGGLPAARGGRQGRQTKAAGR